MKFNKSILINDTFYDFKLYRNNKVDSLISALPKIINSGHYFCLSEFDYVQSNLPRLIINYLDCFLLPQIITNPSEVTCLSKYSYIQPNFLSNTLDYLNCSLI